MTYLKVCGVDKWNTEHESNLIDKQLNQITRGVGQGQGKMIILESEELMPNWSFIRWWIWGGGLLLQIEMITNPLQLLSSRDGVYFSTPWVQTSSWFLFDEQHGWGDSLGLLSLHVLIALSLITQHPQKAEITPWPPGGWSHEVERGPASPAIPGVLVKVSKGHQVSRNAHPHWGWLQLLNHRVIDKSTDKDCHSKLIDFRGHVM